MLSPFELNTDTQTVSFECPLTGEIDEEPWLVYYARGFIGEHLHYNGRYKSIVSDSLWLECYLDCDGFGEVDQRRAAYDLEFDWSHVRDSSDLAMLRVADRLAKRWDTGSIEAQAARAWHQFSSIGLSPLQAI